MELTEEVKEDINEMSYESMLSQWRFAPVGALMFQGESGDYFSKVMAEKGKTADTVKASKKIGWKIEDET